MPLHSSIPVLLFLGLSLVSGSASGTHRVVEADGSGEYPTIQSAIDASQDGDEVWLSPGTFRGEGNRNLFFHGAQVRVRSATGEPSSSVIDCQGSPSEWNRAFIFQGGDGPNASVERLTVRGGCADQGGAVYAAFGAQIRILDCRFESNASTGHGGAIHAADGGILNLEGCVFRDNGARDGAGIYAVGSGTTVNLAGCLFEENRAEVTGGGAYYYDHAGGTIRDCVFRSNVAMAGGAVVFEIHASPAMEGCMFAANTATFEGGAVLIYESLAAIERCTFSGNSAPDRGGALLIAGVNEAPTLRACTIAENAADEGGGIWLHTGWARLTLENTIIAFGVRGEALFADIITDPDMACCDLFGNAGGDWNDVIRWHLGRDGNISADPLFCGDENPSEPYSLEPGSPCAADHDPECGQIGAWPVGCGIVPLRPATWGSIKAGFR